MLSHAGRRRQPDANCTFKPHGSDQADCTLYIQSYYALTLGTLYKQIVKINLHSPTIAVHYIIIKLKFSEFYVALLVYNHIIISYYNTLTY